MVAIKINTINTKTMREFKTIYINNVGEKIQESLYERVTDICAPRPMSEEQKKMARRRIQAMKKRKLC